MTTEQQKELAALRAENARLREALSRVISCIDEIHCGDAGPDEQWKGSIMWVADFPTATYPNTSGAYKQARAALAQKGAQ